MHKGFFAKKCFLGLLVIRIRNAAINRANGSALWFLMEAIALGAFGGYYIIKLIGNRLLLSIRINLGTVEEGYLPG